MSAVSRTDWLRFTGRQTLTISIVWARSLGALTVIAESVPLLWPMHPRTRSRLQSGGIELSSGIRVLEPLGYLDFLSLEADSSIVLTDSGGIQEETTALGVNCLTLRDNTERPATIQFGTNRLAGTRKATILSAWEEVQRSPRVNQIPPLWDGQAGPRCREVLRRLYSQRVLSQTAARTRGYVSQHPPDSQGMLRSAKLFTCAHHRLLYLLNVRSKRLRAMVAGSIK